MITDTYMEDCVMKKQYESPEAEELLVVSESVMAASGEEEYEDDESRDMTVDIAVLLGLL